VPDPVLDPAAPWLIEVPTGHRVQRSRGGVLELPAAWNDPRFIGWLSMHWNTDAHVTTGSRTSVHAVSVRFRSGGGSWVGTLTGTGDPATSRFRLQGELHGLGGYEGTSAVLSLSADGEMSSWRVEGLVVPGDLPPLGD
jgi:hypothetical protein